MQSMYSILNIGVQVHGLQDTEDKHTIHCDEQLQKVGKDKHAHINMSFMLLWLAVR